MKPNTHLLCTHYFMWANKFNVFLILSDCHYILCLFIFLKKYHAAHLSTTDKNVVCKLYIFWKYSPVGMCIGGGVWMVINRSSRIVALTIGRSDKTITTALAQGLVSINEIPVVIRSRDNAVTSRILHRIGRECAKLYGCRT